VVPSVRKDNPPPYPQSPYTTYTTSPLCKHNALPKGIMSHPIRVRIPTHLEPMLVNKTSNKYTKSQGRVKDLHPLTRRGPHIILLCRNAG